jgi:zinc finger-like protein
MATPLDCVGGGGGGVAILSNSTNKVDSSSSLNASLKCSKLDSPILIFLFFHKAIRNELDTLHRLAMAFATGNRSDIQPLFDRYHFLSSIYRHHSNAEDEVQISLQLFYFIFINSIIRFSSFFILQLKCCRN